MSLKARNTSAVVSAGLLASLTLGVFATQVQGGPEATVRKFHEALAAGNGRMLQSTVAQSIQSPSTVFLAQRASYVFNAGGQYRVRKAGSESSIAQVEVAYELPGGQVHTTQWFVVDTKAGWRIDADRTYWWTTRSMVGQ